MIQIDQLTDEDWYLIGQLAQSRTDAEIAADCGIGKSQVDTRLQRLYRTLGLEQTKRPRFIAALLGVCDELKVRLPQS